MSLHLDEQVPCSVCGGSFVWEQTGCTGSGIPKWSGVCGCGSQWNDVPSHEPPTWRTYAKDDRVVTHLVNEISRLNTEVSRLENALPPTESSPGAVGEGTWSVFAQRVVAEREEAREHVRQMSLLLKDQATELQIATMRAQMLEDESDEVDAHVRALLRLVNEYVLVTPMEHAGRAEEVTALLEALEAYCGCDEADA
jgi:hypothetical protein